MEFLKGIVPYIDKLELDMNGYTHIISGLQTGSLASPKDIAYAFYNGNMNSAYSATKRIKAAIIDELLKKEVYHNSAQKGMMDCRLRAALVHKLLYLGHLNAAIDLAQTTYHKAIKYHIYDVAAGMSEKLYLHYGQHIGNLKTCDEWYENHKYSQRQHQIVLDIKYKFARINIQIRHNKKVDRIKIEQVQDMIEVLSAYRDEAESYLYWFIYYELKSRLNEMTGKYNELIEHGLHGYEYFDDLAINHQSAKLAMLAHIIHGYNLKHMYLESMRYLKIVQDINSDGSNLDICQLKCPHEVGPLY